MWQIYQGTENIKDTSDMSRSFALPNKRRLLCRTLWNRAMQAERYKHHFFQLATFFTLGRHLLLLVSNGISLLTPGSPGSDLNPLIRTHCKGRLQNPTAGWPAVPSGSGRLSLFRTIETGRNRTEPPVNRRLGFEAVSVKCAEGTWNYKSGRHCAQ